MYMKNQYQKSKRLKKGSRTPKKLPKYLTESEISVILTNAKNSKMRDYIILLTLWRTGLRVSELVKLTKNDVRDNILVRLGKGHKDRIVPLETELGTILKLYTDTLQPKDRLFNMTSRTIRNIINRYTPEGVHAYPHIFRHSFAVHCLKNGMNLRNLQLILGHENLETTAIYLQLTQQDIIDDFNKIKW